ncbi:MAG: sensor histidine kinase [Oculatellaceae cyanobacterium Prado106]|nr:sensor histidine kinase [Oculatellaceae cyanobacterium Prado106]
MQTFLTVPFLVQIVAVAGLTGWLSWRNGQQSVHELASKLQDEISACIYLKLKSYLSAPQLTSRINSDAAKLGQLNFNDMPSLEQYLFTQLLQFDSVSGILIGTEGGLFRAVNRRGQFRLLKSDPYDDNWVSGYRLNLLGDRTKSLEPYRSAPVQITPWYKAAVEARKPTWSPIFQTDDQDLSLNANYPIYDPDTGDLLGVASAGVVLSKINNFLKNLQVSETGIVFVVEHDGTLIGTSGDQPAYIRNEVTQNKVKLDRIKAIDSQDPLIQATAKFLVNRYGDFTRVIADQRLNFEHDDDRNLVKVVPFRDELGLNWLIVVVVPEDDFMAQINENTQTTALLIAGAVFGTMILGLIGSNWLARPMLRLSRASRAIADGDLYQRVPESSPIQEVEITAHAFNRMAQRVTASFEQIEATNANLEGEVRDRTAQLRHAVEELERLNRIKDDFLSTVSHELRTPMSNIKLSTQMLEISLKRLGILDSETSPVLRYFQILKDEGQREINLINNLLDLSRIDAQQNSLTPTRIDLFTWLPECVKPFIERAHSQQQQFHLQVADDLPTLVTDLEGLERILNELLNNACKYTPPGERIRLLATLETQPNEAAIPVAAPSHAVASARSASGEVWSGVSETLQPQNGNVQNGNVQNGNGQNGNGQNGNVQNGNIQNGNGQHGYQGNGYAGQFNASTLTALPSRQESSSGFVIFRVENSGVEIPRKECDRIFDKFYRIPSSDPWKHGGTGLGLALVKELVERLQGSIWVESQSEQTAFLVRLPLVLQPSSL